MRDLTPAQFQEALQRNQFKLLASWLMDTRPGAGMAGYGIVLTRGSINRRASLARALQGREASDRRRAEAEARKARAHRDMAATIGINPDTGAMIYEPLAFLAAA